MNSLEKCESNTNVIDKYYCAVGILVYIISDGMNVWTDTKHDRNNIINKVESIVANWDIVKTVPSLLHKSLHSIFSLLKQYENPICQLWSSWTLAHLTIRKSSKNHQDINGICLKFHFIFDCFILEIKEYCSFRTEKNDLLIA